MPRENINKECDCIGCRHRQPATKIDLWPRCTERADPPAGVAGFGLASHCFAERTRLVRGYLDGWGHLYGDAQRLRRHTAVAGSFTRIAGFFRAIDRSCTDSRWRRVLWNSRCAPRNDHRRRYSEINLVVDVGADRCRAWTEGVLVHSVLRRCQCAARYPGLVLQGVSLAVGIRDRSDAIGRVHRSIRHPAPPGCGAASNQRGASCSGRSGNKNRIVGIVRQRRVPLVQFLVRAFRYRCGSRLRRHDELADAHASGGHRAV